MAHGASPDDAELLTAAELARRAGVVVSTIGNWRKLPDRPLKTVSISGGAFLFTWRDLEEFCRAHPNLPGVTKIRRRITNQAPPLAGGNSPAATTPEVEDLKSLARD